MAASAAERMARKRARDKARAQVEAGGGTVLAPELLARHADGTLWTWEAGTGWRPL